MPLAVMLRSMEMALRETSKVIVHVLDGGMGWRNRNRIRRSLATGRIELNWIKPDTGALGGVPVFGHAGLATYYRLLIPSLMGPDVAKVLYLDVDMVVLRDIGQLWRVPMENRPLMAVRQGTETLGSLAFAGELGLDPKLPYANAGVLVMNLAAWRSGKTAERVIDVLVRFRKGIRFWDQDGINAILAGQWGELDPAWNVTVDCFVPDGGTVPVEQMPARLKERAAIVHYASACKPWAYYVDHPAKELFYEYLTQTSWAGWRPRPPIKALMSRHYWGGKLRNLCPSAFPVPRRNP